MHDYKYATVLEVFKENFMYFFLVIFLYIDI